MLYDDSDYTVVIAVVC